MVDSFNPPDVWKPFGAFAIGAIQGTGQVALDRDGKIAGKGDMRAQVRRTLENILAVLAGIGGTMGDVVSLTHYATDIEQFMKTGDIRREFFAAPFPVTTTVQVSRLYDLALMIEIAAIAEIPRDRFKRPPAA